MELSKYLENETDKCINGRKVRSLSLGSDEDFKTISGEDFMVGLYHSDCVDLPYVVMDIPYSPPEDMSIRFERPHSGVLNVGSNEITATFTIRPTLNGTVDSFAIADSDGQLLLTNHFERELYLRNIDSLTAEDATWELE